MARVDLHVHSKFSDHPSEWFLQRLGTSESYTEPEYIYITAKQRGMTLVTISDHNSIQGSLELNRRHPEDTFVSVESTAYFPEDGCKIHILLMGISEAQFDRVQELRSDIYRLRDYIREEEIAYSVAHATYSVNGAVTEEHLEKLILLFDVFEGINGGRNERNNSEWALFLNSLTEEDIRRLQGKHGIEPISSTPWIKGFTAGSDDHAGIFIGKTYTGADAEGPAEFLKALRQKRTEIHGRHHNFHSMTFMIYKIAFDFLRYKHRNNLPAPIAMILEGLFNEEELDLKKAFALKRMKRKKKKSAAQRIFVELIEEVRGVNFHEIDVRLDIVYDKAALLLDTLFEQFFDSIQRNLRKGNIDKLMRNFSSLLPAIFLSVPFLSTFTHMFNNRKLVSSLYDRLEKDQPKREKRILWFTDTLSELNGVAITVKEIGWLAHGMKKNIRIATSLDNGRSTDDLPPNIMDIPTVKNFPLPHYEKLTLRVPSLLKTLKLINDYDPDEIYISTPMTLGLTGLAAAKLLDIPATAVYHTDVTLQAKEIINDITMTHYVENYMKWFYSACDRTLVNTREYATILKERGYRADGIGLFRRGVDTDLFKPLNAARTVLQDMYGIPGGINLLYAGRISKDKSVGLVVEAYRCLKEEFPELNLILAGEGPETDQLMGECKQDERVFFLGRIDHDIMPLIYSGSDLFLFPSTTDTFGRVVAEGQACGLPVMVSNVGGPQEIVVDGETGRILTDQHPETWIRAAREYLELLRGKPEEYARIRISSRESIVRQFNLQHFISGLFATKAKEPSLQLTSG